MKNTSSGGFYLTGVDYNKKNKRKNNDGKLYIV